MQVSYPQLSCLDVAEYRSYLQRLGKKPTVNRHLILLRIFYNWLAEKKIVPDNLAEGIKPVTAQEPNPKWLTCQEQDALMRAVREDQNHSDEALITLLLHTGLMVDELVNFRREDVQLVDRCGKVTVRQGKGNKYREVSLNKTTRRALQRWL